MTDRVEAFGQFARAIAEHLGCQAQIQNTLADLVFSADRQITLRHDDGRVYVSGRYPTRDRTMMSPRDWGVVPYHEPSPGMSVSLTRDPAAVARAITRKFLPAYTELFQKCVDAKQQWRKECDDTDIVARRLAELLSEEVRGEGMFRTIYVHAKTLHGECRVTGDRVEMKFTLPAFIALELGVVLSQHLDRKGADA